MINRINQEINPVNQNEYHTLTKAAIMKHKELTERIRGCAYRVYGKMGYGFLESVYEKCLMIELK